MSHENSTRRFYQEVWPQRATLLRTALMLTRNVAEAEDIVQEALLKSFRSIDQLDKATGAKSWLMAILRNTWIDRLRSTARTRAAISLEESQLDVADERATPGAEHDGSPRAILEEMTDQTLIDALVTLPEEIRWTVLLCDVQQLDHADAAKVLDIPVGTVKSRIFRGRGMLRATLLKTMAKANSGDER